MNLLWTLRNLFYRVSRIQNFYLLNSWTFLYCCWTLLYYISSFVSLRLISLNFITSFKLRSSVFIRWWKLFVFINRLNDLIKRMIDVLYLLWIFINHRFLRKIDIFIWIKVYNIRRFKVIRFILMKILIIQLSYSF